MLIRIVATSLILFILSVQLTLAQTPTPSPQQTQLIEAIQQRAQKDIELGKPAAGIADLNVLFGEEAKQVGLSMREVLDIYETAYDEAKPEIPWWQQFSPNIGWIAAGILSLLLILGNVIKTYLTKFFEAIGETIYKRLSGTKLLRWQALRRYRRALLEKYETLKIPFRPNRPLAMAKIYVPLRVAETNGQEVEAMQAIKDHKWLMVVGEPGSGKSVFLRRLALAYAQGELHHIPILLELHRLSELTNWLQTYLVDVLARNDFPNAESFIQVGLEHGLFLLLFDGLDEVPTDQRKRVVRHIKDLLDRHDKCRAVITCRTAVYHGEFDNWANQKLEIVEFSDQQIHSFLAAWGDMPQGKSAEHLLGNLRERPNIMALARNPLLLTIIAYLYTDTPFVLPHSRAEFYDKSISELLEKWDQEKDRHNQYKPGHKRLILQHLALFNQDSAKAGNEDRRSIDLTTALREIKTVLPSLTLRDEDAQPILEEIEERSGLMLLIDGGTKYQFTHLTLQEFFAAQALKDKTQDLLARFQQDPDAWLETIKLWCGLDHDSTHLVETVYAQNPMLGFECLADAQQINADFVDKVLAEMQTHLRTAPAIDGAAIRAFATVAADPRPRGQALLANLSQMLADGSLNFQRRLDVAGILARTNLPQAAEVLAQHAAAMPDIRPYLVQMGDLALPGLMRQMTAGEVWRLDALHDIGTPGAAEKLVELIWESGETAYHAAWRLTAILPKTGVEEALQQFACTPIQRQMERLSWVWAPFDEDSQSSLSIIAGRVAHLLHTSPVDTLPAEARLTPDPRLVIPLCAVAVQPNKLKTLTTEMREKLEDKIQSQPLPPGKLTEAQSDLAAQQEFVTEAANNLSDDPSWHYLIETLPLPLRFELLQRLVLKTPKPNQNDWRNLFQPVKYQFAGSWHERGIRLALGIICALGLWQGAANFINSSSPTSWQNALLVVVGLALGVAIWRLVTKHLNTATVWLVLFSIALVSGPVGGMIGGTIAGVILGAIGGAIGGAIVGEIFGESFRAIFRAILGAILGAIIGAIGGALSGALSDTISGATGSAISGAISGTLFFALFLAISDAIKGETGNAIRNTIFLSATIGAIFGAIGTVLFFLPAEFFFERWDWPIAVLFWAICFAVLSGLNWHGSQRERLAQNPLQGLLDKQERKPLIQRKFGLLRLIPWWVFRRMGR